MTTASLQHEQPVSIDNPSAWRNFKDRLATTLVWAAFAFAMVPLVWILYTVISRGAVALFDPLWWSNSQRGMTIMTPGGGAYHAIMGTLLQALVCALISVPIAVMTAVYLVEYGGGRFARIVSFMVDILTGVPSIVAALFVYALWVTTFHFERVGFAVSLALVLLMIPTVVRSTEEMLRLVPSDLREASYALGVPKWKTIMRIVLPTSMSGIVTGVMLGLARVMGETAPLVVLGPYSKSINFNLFDGLMGALPTMINQDRTESTQYALERTWGAALTLIILVLLLNLAARLVAKFNRVQA